jgi:hypothetical protein
LSAWAAVHTPELRQHKIGPVGGFSEHRARAQPEEIQLIQAGLRLRLVAEDDRSTIDGLRYLIARIDREIRVAAP